MSEVRLKDIAEKAGVSIMTVSNVINGKNNRVSAKTIDRINAIIEECGYVPNLSARSLTNKTSNIIGIVISPYESNYEEANHLENPYISTMVGTIEKELRHEGYFTMVRSVSKKEDFTTLFRNWNVDGIIFLYPEKEEFIKLFVDNSRCPVAIFDSSLNIPGLISVSSDDWQGLYLSTKYMINHGHSHIAFVANYEGNPLLTRRFNGYRSALEESHIPFRPEYVYPYPPTYEGGIEAGKKIAVSRNEITAAVTTADICAIGVMEGAKLGGYRIPVDLSIIGYDNLQLCQYTTPKLTSISQDITRKAIQCTRLLLEKIRRGTTSSPSRIIMGVEIVERQSVISLF
ncbi:MAG TPA: LacI family transcriptional regulator [Candidatus Blautia merdipullorum]|nr:LacI family transcriptional regulator [Candidatus Blautia merdipullorum]